MSNLNVMHHESQGHSQDQHAVRGRPKTNRYIQDMTDTSSLTIQGPPIPEDLFWLYKTALVGDTAVCSWNDVGAKNSRWVNVPEKQPYSLINLLERIARLEDGLTNVLDVVWTSTMCQPEKDAVGNLISSCLDEAKNFRQDYKLQNDRLRQAEQRLSNEEMRMRREPFNNLTDERK
jgi:hypothetical protein